MLRPWVVVILLVLAMAAALAARRVGATRRSLALPATIVLASIIMISGSGPGALWRHGGIGAGRGPGQWRTPNEMRSGTLSEERSIVWQVDGIESSVALKGSHGFSLVINGKVDGHCRTDAPTQVMSPLVGAALHPDPRTGLIIGLGTGSSAGWLAQVDSIERVDVVELEPAVLRIAEACASINHDVTRHPKVETLLADGREVLLTTDRRYDVVFSEPRARSLSTASCNGRRAPSREER